MLEEGGSKTVVPVAQFIVPYTFVNSIAVLLAAKLFDVNIKAEKDSTIAIIFNAFNAFPAVLINAS